MAGPAQVGQSGMAARPPTAWHASSQHPEAARSAALSAPARGDATVMHNAHPEELDQLSDLLRAKGFKTDLITPPNKRPYLHVCNPHAGALAENIVVAAGWYWYSWAERIAPMNEVASAAERINTVLRTADSDSKGAQR